MQEPRYWAIEQVGFDMGWLKEKIFGPKKSQYEDLAEKFYDVLVLDGGPSGNSDSHIDATSLEVPLGKLERFSQKRLISLEALLFVAAQTETVERSAKLQAIFGADMLHPFAAEMGKLICRKWRERGIKVESFDMAKRCFQEVEDFLEKPFRWSRNWLNEFYDNPEQSGEHYIMWTDQWLKEYETMRTMVAEHS
jgi:hypothetical protein